MGIDDMFFGKRSSLDFAFHIGSGFDHASLHNDQILLTSGEMTTVIKVGVAGPFYTVVSTNDDFETELFRGNLEGANRAFETVKRSIFGPRRLRSTAAYDDSRRNDLTWLFGVGFAVMTVIAILSVSAGRSSNADINSTLKTVFDTQCQQSGGIPTTTPEGQSYCAKLDELSKVTGGTSPALDMPVIKPQVAPAEQGAPVSSGASLELPNYSPDLYKTSEKSGEPSSSAPVPPKEAAGAVTADMPQAKNAVAEKPGDGATDKAVSIDVQTVVTKLKDAGLTKDEAEKALKQISMLTADQLSGSSLDALPPEVRKILLETAAKTPSAAPADDSKKSNQTPEKQASVEPENGTDGDPNETFVKDGVAAKIILLPQQVIDSFREHDGIASIPENSSWQARGNPPVSIPLPGDGDIKSVEDLKAFGLHP